MPVLPKKYYNPITNLLKVEAEKKEVCERSERAL